MARGGTDVVPIPGDHWLCTEWSSVRKHLPTLHGTKKEAIVRLYSRVAFLKSRGWRVTMQKLSADTLPGERRMLVRIEPPAEYQHCGDSVIEYRSCGAPVSCTPCASVAAVAATIDQARDGYADDPDRARCSRPVFERGICAACGKPLRLHMHRLAREAAEAMQHVSTSRHSGGS